MVTAMDAVGVDGAILVSPYTMYRYDAELRPRRTRRPSRPVRGGEAGRSRPIPRWPIRSPTGQTTKGTVAHPDHDDARACSTDAADPGINRVLAAAARHSLPVNLLCRGRLEQVGQLAARNPETRLVIDHLGLQQPFEPPAPAEPWAELPKLLALAAHDNVVVKISGACTL